MEPLNPGYLRVRAAVLALALCACRGSSTVAAPPEATGVVAARRTEPGPAAGDGARARNDAGRTRGSIRLARFAGGETPAYPEVSRRLGEQGAVELRIGLRSDGSVASLEITSSSGHERLDEATLAAARTWRFNPRTGPDELEVLRHRFVFRLVESP